MARIFKPPAPFALQPDTPSVFLAGSIAMGRAEAWQAVVEHAFRDAGIVIFNPRRDDWDAAWEQRIDNPQFREQVEWELAAQEQATLILMYFAPTTRADHAAGTGAICGQWQADGLLHRWVLAQGQC